MSKKEVKTQMGQVLIYYCPMYQKKTVKKFVKELEVYKKF